LCLILTSCASVKNPTEEELEDLKKECDRSDLRKIIQETAISF
jgi:hypothetical protein